ncbi:MAG: ABC transporter ATP-binding protein [Planctomycetes bacterium]|nr:ABC transporter ATP-binding protein [Planctomycetota bacterium]
MPVLQIAGLKKSFVSPDGERTPIIDVPAFSLEEGAQIALAGSSGSGKTTFLNLIAGILQADEGKITVAGHAMTGMSESGRDAARANAIGYVFQTFNLLQGFTALENVELGMMFGPGIDAARARQLLEHVGLKDRLHYRPRQLSVGQQQRVAVARAVANRPKLVLADEPTGNLDHRLAKDSLLLIRETCKECGAALLLVSHDREVLAQFEKVEELAKINRAAEQAPAGEAKA